MSEGPTLGRRRLVRRLHDGPARSERTPQAGPMRAALVDAVLQARRTLYRALDAAHGPDWTRLDISMPQLKVLMLLGPEREHHLGSVAERLCVSLPTASHLVDRLVRQGLVSRRENPADRRYVLLERTPAGTDLVECLRRTGEERMRGWLEQLGDRQLAGLADGFEALAEVARRAVGRNGTGGPVGGCR